MKTLPWPLKNGTTDLLVIPAGTVLDFITSRCVSSSIASTSGPPFPTVHTCVACSVCRPECIAEAKELLFTQLSQRKDPRWTFLLLPHPSAL